MAYEVLLQPRARKEFLALPPDTDQPDGESRRKSRIATVPDEWGNTRSRSRAGRMTDSSWASPNQVQRKSSLILSVRCNVKP